MDDACTARFALNADLTLKDGVISCDETPSPTMQVDLDLGNNRLINLQDPTDPQDAATKTCVDDLSTRVFCIAHVGADAKDKKPLFLVLETTFQQAPSSAMLSGSRVNDWDISAGHFTAPETGLYAIDANLRVRRDSAEIGTLGNIYTQAFLTEQITPRTLRQCT